MKDMFGAEIEVGNQVIYAKAFSSQHLEKAIVVEKGKNFIKIEYLGISTYPIKQYCKAKGDKGRITATEKRIVILNSDNIVIDNVYKMENEKLYKVIKSIEAKVLRSYDREKKLIEEKKILQAEVDKIHDRFDILDL